MDSSWMGEFRDFTSNDFDNFNLDLELEDENIVCLSAREYLDLNFYQHFRMVDAKVWVDHI